MKFKRLTIDELKILENEFVTFLASNQITATDWEKIKSQDEEKVNDLINLFSDIVYSKALTKIKYLEYKEEKEINLFYCGEAKITLIGIKAPLNSSINFNEDAILDHYHKSNKALSIFVNEKEYQKERKVEVFEMLQSGCVITDEKTYNALASIYKV